MANQSFIDFHVVVRHAGTCEALVEFLAAAPPIELTYTLHRLHRSIDAVHYKSGNAVLDDLRNRSPTKRNDWCSAGQRFDHHQAEWLRPVNRKQQRECTPKKRALVVLPDLPNELHQRVVQQMFNFVVKVLSVNRVDFRCNLELDT